MKENITPVGLKGNQITERMKQLMGVQPITENKKTSVLELTKVGPDNKVYGIVRENHEYYIKTTDKKTNLVVEDFAYIGGLQNKKDCAHHSYAKAIKHLNLKFNSLNEAYGKDKYINVFENDNLESNTEGGADVWSESEVEEVEPLSEVEQDVEDMCEDDTVKESVPAKQKLSISRSINQMDSIIESFDTPKKKVYSVR